MRWSKKPSEGETSDPAPARAPAGRSRYGRGGRAKADAPQKPMTREAFERGAFRYIERFATSAENLRRVLRRKIQRAERRGVPVDAVEAQRWIEELIVRWNESGILDDKTYAAAKTKTLHRRGLSQRSIKDALWAKGVDSETSKDAVSALGEHPEEVDLVAAISYARRRRLGPFRRDKRKEAREKDIAALGRRGFNFDIAKRVIDAPDEDTIEAMTRGLE